MKIEVSYVVFSEEFHADIEIDEDCKKYIASDCLKTLFEEIYEIAWNFRNNI